MLNIIVFFLMNTLFITNGIQLETQFNTILPDGYSQYYHHRADEVSLVRPENEFEYMLPRTTKPIHYKIYLTSMVDRNVIDFFGEVTIEIEVTVDSTNDIVLHSLVNIQEILLFESDHATVVESSYEENAEFQFLTIHAANKNLFKGEKYFIYITYRALLREDVTGFYFATFRNSKNVYT